MASLTVLADDQPQWGQRHSRNMVSGETGLAETFDPATGQNIKWVAPLGTETYSTPVVANGRVLIGTNNGQPRDARHKGDRGVLLCLDEKDGSLCWQLIVPKLGPDPYLDWPRAGMVSPATVEGDRIYIVSNRNEVMCLDLKGQADGNDGPYQDEARHATPQGAEPAALTEKDADIIWLYDICAELVPPHDSAHSSILVDGQFLYVNTSSGKDSSHRRVRVPEAPSLIVLDKTTGRLIAQDDEQIGPRIFHGLCLRADKVRSAGGRGGETEKSLAVRLRPDRPQTKRAPIHSKSPGKSQQYKEHARILSQPLVCDSRGGHLVGQTSSLA